MTNPAMPDTVRYLYGTKTRVWNVRSLWRAHVAMWLVALASLVGWHRRSYRH
jgi:hypothetical protein